MVSLARGTRATTTLGAVLWALSIGAIGAAGSSGCTDRDATDTTPAAATPAEATPRAADPEPAPARTLPLAKEVLARAAEAMGGRDALDRVKSFYYRGTIEIPGQNIHGTLEIWWKGGDFYMEQAVEGIGLIRAGKQGQEIWAEDPINGRRKLSGIEAEQHAWASSLLLAAEWTRYFDEAETIDERTDGGRTVHDVRLRAASGLQVTMSFDAATGLQVGQAFEQITPMGTQPFEVRFEDYREVEGIKLAYRQVIDARIQQVVQEITEIRLNADVDASRFAFPRASADLVVQPAEPGPDPGPEPEPDHEDG